MTTNLRIYRIRFTSNRGGAYFQIYTMRPDGTDVQQVGVVPDNNAMYPHYSPDSSRIVYASCRNFLDADLYAVNPDTGTERPSQLLVPQQRVGRYLLARRRTPRLQHQR